MANKPADSPFVKGDLIEFHYQKTPLYRGIHVDGFWGGVTPRGILAISFFHERQPIPKHAQRRVLVQSDTSMTAGPEEVTDVLAGVVRQIEDTLYMDVKVAQELYVWLGMQVAAMESSLAIPDDQRVAKIESQNAE